MKTKNSFLELLRIVFCLIIFMHHSGFLAEDGMNYPFKSAGFYAVEFFFILTGALTCKHIEKKTHDSSSCGVDDGIMKSSLCYTVTKLKKIFPYALLGIVLSYVFYFVSADYTKSVKDIVFGSWNIIYEALFLPMTGIMNADLNVYLNSPLWYLSAMLITLPVIMYLKKRFSDVFENYLCIFLPLIMHGYLINKYGTVGSFGTFGVLTYTGVIRGFSDILLGFLAYRIAKVIDEKMKNDNMILTFVEVLSYIFVIYTFNTNVDAYTYEFAILLLMLSLGISFSGKTYTSKVSVNFLDHLGKLSVPIYCIHWPVYKFVSFYFGGISYWLGILVTLLVCILISECMMFIVKKRNS